MATLRLPKKKRTSFKPQLDTIKEQNAIVSEIQARIEIKVNQLHPYWQTRIGEYLNSLDDLYVKDKNDYMKKLREAESIIDAKLQEQGNAPAGGRRKPKRTTQKIKRTQSKRK